MAVSRRVLSLVVLFRMKSEVGLSVSSDPDIKRIEMNHKRQIFTFIGESITEELRILRKFGIFFTSFLKCFPNLPTVEVL